MLWVLLGGQVIEGGCVSFTVTVKLQLCGCCVVQVTVVVPFGKKEPEGGAQVTVPQPEPLGVALL